MSYSLGQLVGAIFGMIVLTSIASLLTKRFWQGKSLIFGTVAVAYVFAVVLYAFGSADGGPVKWTAGVVSYGLGALIVGLGWYFLSEHKKKTEL